MELLWYFFAGFFAWNGVPHLVKGITGQSHMTPFAKVSSPVLNVVWAFIAFCLATSGTYIFNDIMDAKRDRLHPIKKNRPIAKGTLPVPIAFITFLILGFGSLYIARLLNPLFLLLLLHLLLFVFLILV